MQTLPRLFCRFRRFWFSKKSARLLFFLPRGSEILRQNAAKRCVAAVGKAKKSGSSGKSCVCCASQKNKTNLLSLMQNVAYEPLMLQPSALLLRATSDIFRLPPHHLIGFTALPFSCTFLMYPTPCPTSETVRKHRKSKALVQEMQDFFWIFFEGGRKGRKPEIENIGLLCIKHPYFHAKTSALYIIEVRCF